MLSALIETTCPNDLFGAQLGLAAHPTCEGIAIDASCHRTLRLNTDSASAYSYSTNDILHNKDSYVTCDTYDSYIFYNHLARHSLPNLSQDSPAPGQSHAVFKRLALIEAKPCCHSQSAKPPQNPFAAMVKR